MVHIPSESQYLFEQGDFEGGGEKGRDGGKDVHSVLTGKFCPVVKIKTCTFLYI